MEEKDKEVIKKEDETVTTQPPVDSTETIEDVEARIAKLEEEKANYKLAFLKEKSKNKHNSDDDDYEEETEEERIERIVNEKIAEKKILEIDGEKDKLLKQLAKENKELKLAHLHKPTDKPTTMGSHSEGVSVTDTTVTPEQLQAFKNRGWTEKDIERYKANLKKYSGR
jgi:hypothetical protein